MIKPGATLEYLEKPATADEKKIALLLEKLTGAINTKNLLLLGEVYSEDALIEMLVARGAYLSKREYLERMLRIVQGVSVLRYGEILIRVDASVANVHCVSSLYLCGKAMPRQHQRYFRCLKNEAGNWQIVEARYV